MIGLFVVAMFFLAYLAIRVMISACVATFVIAVWLVRLALEATGLIVTSVMSLLGNRGSRL